MLTTFMPILIQIILIWANYFPISILGKISSKITLKCNNISKTNNNIYIDGIFPRFEYNNYQYKNILVKGLYDKNIFDGLFKLDDPNGQINIEGRYQQIYQKKHP